MRNIYTSCLAVTFFILLSVAANGQLTGTKNIPGDYATIEAAVTDLNTLGVGGGGVTFNVAAGHTEIPAGPILITATGTAANPIVFQKSGAGANPLVSRTDAGAVATTVLGGQGDAIIIIEGSDYITFDMIDVSATQDGIEYGYYLRKVDGTDGCKNVTIKNSVITLTKGANDNGAGIYSSNNIPSSTVSSSTGVTVTSTGGRNENNSFTGNTISNVFAGIVVRGYNHTVAPRDFYDQNVVVGANGAGNIIQNVAGNVNSTSYGVYLIYQNNANVSYNTIDNAGGGGAGATSIFYGIFHSTGTTSSFTATNNIINVTSASTSSSLYGINNSATGDLTITGNAITLNNGASSSGTYGYIYNSGATAATTLTISNNTFNGSTITVTGSTYLIYNSVTTAAAANIQNNVTSGTINRAGASGTLYGYYSLSSPTGVETVSGNNFSNFTLAGTSSFTGVNSNTTAAHTHHIFNNTISNATGSSGTYTGIAASSAGTRSIYDNQVFNLNSAGSVVGISNGSGGATAINIYRNKVYDLNSSSTATTAGLVSGIAVTSGSAGSIANVYNNLVGNLTAPTAAGTDAIRGISVTSTAATTNVNLYYNSIYFAAASGGADFGTSGIYHTTNATATTANLTLRNNVIVNKSTPAGTGVTAAYRRSSIATANYNAASNNNLFYAGTPSVANLIYTDGTNSFSDLAAYQAFISVVGADQASVTEDLPFQSTTGSSADFLKYNATVVNKAESGAENITGITDDYAGSIRQGNAGYTGTGLKPDIGAWELEGVLPSCVGTPAASNTVSSQNPACSGAAFILSLDQAYLGVTYQWESSADNVTYTPITGADAATFITTITTTTWYRCIISCNGNNRVSTPLQVLINPPLAGTYTIDNLVATGGTNYNNFTDAINDLNCRGISASVVFNVPAGQTFNEASALNITAEGTAVNTITFQKSGAGANPKITRPGTSATNDYVVKLTGADYVTFDGIDIDQSGASATDWVEFGLHIINASATNGAKNNTFKNGIISLSNANASAKGVYVQSPVTPTDVAGTNENNRFLNMTVQNSYEGYRIQGASTTYPDNGNEINTESSGTSLVQNLGDGTVTGSLYGIFASYQTNLKIKNTEVSNLLPGGTSLVYGITLQSSSANTAEFSGNRIHGLTGGGTVTGISITSVDTADVFNNEVYSLTTNGNTSAIRGLDIGGTGANVNIYANRVYGIQSNGTTTTTAGGIEVASGNVFNIYNNMISGLSAPASTSTSGGTKGIATSGSTSGQVVNIYFNTVVLSDAGTVAGYTSAGFYNSSSTPVVDFRNNIIINKSDVTTGTRAVAYWKNNTTINQHAATNNNLYYAGAPGAKNLLYYDGTNAAQTIAAIQAISGMGAKESLSATEDVQFVPVVNGIIRPLASAPTLTESTGQNIPGYSTDFENTARGPYPLAGQTNGGGTAPDLGADEGDFTFVIPALPDCPTLTIPANNSVDLCPYNNIVLNWNPAATGGPATLGFDVYFGTSATPPFVANTSDLSYTVSGLLPNTVYYWQIVPKNVAGSAIGCTTYSFTTTNSAVTSTTGDTRCGPGTVNLSATGSGTLSWYADPTGGAPLATGTSYSPSVTSTTTYYVGAATGLGSGIVGRNESTAGTSGTSASTYGLCFDALVDITIDSVTIILNTASGGTLNIQLRDSLNGSSGAGAFIRASASIPVPTGAIGDRVRIPIGFSVPAGQGYRLLAISSPSLVRSTSGSAYPYTSSNNTATITSGFITNSGSASYYYFYDWQVTNACASSRVPVTATVTAPPAINATVTNATICEGQSTQLDVTSGNAGYTYVWNPGNLAGALQTVSPATSTAFIVTATDNSGGANDGCVNTATVNVTVNPIPTAVTVTATTDTVCSDSPAQLLTASGGLMSGTIVFSEDFNGTAAGWTTVNNSTGASAAAAAWTLQPDGYVYGSTPVTFHSNDNSQFYLSNSDAAGSGSTTSTILQSPVFSLAGFTSANLSFWHYYRRSSSPDSISIEVSTNGTTWTTEQSYVTAQGASTGFVNVNLNLDAYAGQSTVSIRFRYEASFDWYWAIDNVVVSGTGAMPITWSPLAGLFTDPGATVAYTGTPATTVYAKPVTTTTYTATATNGLGCTNYDTTVITVTPAPSATIAYTGSPYCGNAGTATVTQTGTAGGAYSSTTGLAINASTGDIDLAASTPGTYTVTYTIAAAGGCSQFQATTSVTISPAPSATISYAGSPYCSGGGTATVTLTGNTGGTFSSTAGLAINATTGEVDLAASTVGTYTVTYIIAAAGGCAVFTATADITISTSPAAVIAYTGSPYCSNGGTAPVTQTGSTGGTYSSTAGLSINAATGEITLGTSTPGTYVVTYTIAAGGGCSAFSTTASVTITVAPSATISYAGSPYCSNAGTATVTHGGTTGGTYSSTPGLSVDATTGAIDLAASTAGTYTVTYSIAAANGCALYTTTADVTITAAPSATISYAGSPYCSNGGMAAVTQTGTAGGAYSSTTGLIIDAATGAIDLAASTAGTYTVTYTVAAAGGCAQFQTTTGITITAAPSAAISYAGSPYCSNGGTATVTHTGTTGGAYTSTAGLSINATTGAVDLAASTPGTYTVTYTVAAAGGCALFATTADITISLAPNATIAYTGSPFCISSGPVNVIQTGTTGGVYSSTTGLSINTSTGEINPATSTPGTYTITYTIAAANGCAQFGATTDITIMAAGTWLGTTSSNWNTASNWCGGIPTSTTDVIIPSTAPNMPVLTGNGTAANITISNGATLTIGVPGVLDLYGSISGAGAFNATTGSIAFRGATDQSVPGFTATNVTMNGAGGATPGGDVTITGSLTLTNGNITIGNNDLVLHNSSTGSVTSHVVTNGTGNVVVANLSATQSRTVPTGSDATSYNPVVLAANTIHTTDNFTVRVQQGVFENGVSGTTFSTHVADRMWTINEGTAGGSNVNVTLQWTGVQELTSFNRDRCYVMQHNGTIWVRAAETAAGGTDPYTQTKMNVTTFSPFAVETQRIPRPVTGLYPNPTRDDLNVVTDLRNGGRVIFNVYDAKGRKVYSRQETLNAGLSQTTLNLSHLSSGIYILKVSTGNDREFMVRQFVKTN